MCTYNEAYMQGEPALIVSVYCLCEFAFSVIIWFKNVEYKKAAFVSAKMEAAENAFV